MKTESAFVQHSSSLPSLVLPELLVFCDGLCEPNPGHAAWAWVAYIQNQKFVSYRGYLGYPRTNNDAEYTAVGKALRFVADTYPEVPTIIKTDSQLVVRQLSGLYACNSERLRHLRDRCRELQKQIRQCEIAWIPREENEEADRLTRIAYMEALGHDAPVREKKRRAQ